MPESGNWHDETFTHWIVALPAATQSLPPLDVYDADGRPFELSQLQGHYTVVVFGCLT